MNYLEHHGIKGQKWGIRRFQNEDGSLTEAGKQRYYVTSNSSYDRVRKVEKRARREAPKFEKQGNYDVAAYVRKQGEKAHKERKYYDKITLPSKIMKASFGVIVASPAIYKGAEIVSEKLANKAIATISYLELKQMFK